MATQQTVNPIFASTSVATNSYPLIVAGPGSTPDYGKAIPWQGATNIMQAMDQLVRTAAQFRNEVYDKVQTEADNNARMRIDGQLSAYMQSYRPQMDQDAAKLQIDGIMDKMNMALEKESPNLSDKAKRNLTDRVNLARQQLQIHQDFGRMQLVAEDAKNLWSQGLEQSVKSGDDAKIDEYLEVAKTKGYRVTHTADELHSRAALSREIYNKVNNLDLPRLNALSEQLAEDVDAKGDSTLINGMRREQNLEALQYVRRIKAEKEVAADASLEELARTNKLTPSALYDQFAAGEITMSQYNAFRNRFDAAEHKLTEARKQALDDRRWNVESAIESMEWAPDEAGRKQQYAAQLDAINKGGFDDRRRVDLKRSLDRALKESQSGAEWKQDANYKMGVDMIDNARKNSKLYADPDGLFNKKNDDDFQNARMAELHTAFVSAYRKDPKAFQQPETVQNFIKNRIAELNKGAVESLLQKSYSAAPLSASDLSAAKSRSAVPTAGAVVGGYRYLGGDPKKQASWEAVK